MRDRSRAVVQLVATAVLWSLAGPLMKRIDWNPMAIAGTRSAIAAMMFLPLVRRERFTGSGPQVGAAIAYAVTVTLFAVANKWTTAANAILLQYTAPAWIALCAPWYLNERPRWIDWTVMAVMLAGMALFFLDDLSVRGGWGNLMAVGTGVSFAWVAMFMRKQKDAAPFESVFLGNVLAAGAGLPFAFGPLPASGGSVGLAVVLLAALGVFQMGLSYILYVKAIRHVTALEAMLIPAIEPVLNPMLVFLTCGEKPGRWAALGGAVVLGAVAARCFADAGAGRK